MPKRLPPAGSSVDMKSATFAASQLRPVVAVPATVGRADAPVHGQKAGRDKSSAASRFQPFGVSLKMRTPHDMTEINGEVKEELS